MKKKEVEMVLRVNNQWCEKKFFTFSSYKSGYPAMYHRIIFNVVLLVLVLFECIFVSYVTIGLISL